MRSNARDEYDEGVPMPIHHNIEDGALYNLKMTNIHTDFETGYVDGFDLEFVKIEKK
jgi:hypothetical protein